MVVGVFEAGLEHVVVDITNRQLRAHAGDAHRLELEVGHGAGRVLRQRLVDAQRDLFAGDGIAVKQVAFDDLPGQALAHDWLRGCGCFRANYTASGFLAQIGSTLGSGRYSEG